MLCKCCKTVTKCSRITVSCLSQRAIYIVCVQGVRWLFLPVFTKRGRLFLSVLQKVLSLHHNKYSMTDTKMDIKTQAYLDFLRFSLHEEAPLPASARDIDWEDLFQFGSKQSICGVLFHGIRRLKTGAPHPEGQVLMRWMAISAQLRNANRQVYQDAARLSARLTKETGWKGVVMKGQANAVRYPDPYMRHPGDIDLWTTADPVSLVVWAQHYDPTAEVGYHHVEFGVMKTPVELHFVPSFMGNLFYEWRLRRYFAREKEAQFQNTVQLPDALGEIRVLEPCFDCVFQLTHLMHHYFFEGIGLRQFIDLFYLLHDPQIKARREEVMRTVRRLSMRKFTAAVMYVMRDVLGLPDAMLLCKPSEKLGRQLLDEMLKAGNFGFHDDRYNFHGMSVYRQYLLETFRNLHFALEYPSETVFGRPLSRWWHMFYKMWLRRQIVKAKSRQ